jgi:nucleotide-binding universal stress UspA family protein
MATPQAPQRKVIVAVDNSNWAEAAFDWFVKNACPPDTEVICFHSVEPPWIASGEAVGLSPEAYMMSVECAETSSKEIEEKFAAKMKQNNIKGRVVVKFSTRPGEAIVEMAAAEHATMVVMGTRGLGAIRRTVLGSVSDYVLHHAHCPVAVCSHHRPRGTSLSSSH